MRNVRNTTLLLVFSVCCFAVQLNAQRNAATPNKASARGEERHQQQTDTSLADRHRLQAQAKQAFDAEMTRANRKGGNCQGVTTTRGEQECLSKESETTEQNYKSFSVALRALLAPSHADEDQEPATGPEGQALTPAQQTAEFDKVEKVWQPYRDALCTAAFHQGGGGTIAPALEMKCRQEALRDHMRDLDRTYGLALSIR